MGIFSSARRWAPGTAVVAFCLLAVGCSTGGEADAAADDVAAPSSSIASGVDSAETETTTTTTTVADDPIIAVSSDVGVSDVAIRIGYSLDLSGPSSVEDALLLDGHFARVDAANDAGGIAGREIQIVVLDNRGDPELHQQNIASLAADEADGVVAIGGLSQPAFDAPTAAAVGASELLVVGNRGVEPDVLAPPSFVPLRPTVCSDTETGIAALAAASDDEATQLALLTSDEDWAQASASVAKSVAEDLELEVVLDTSFDSDADNAQAELLEALIDADAEMVWLSGSPEFLAEVGAVLLLDEDERSWTWGGTSATSAASVFNSIVGPVIGDVYQVSQAGPLVEDAELSNVREALALAAPELTYGEAAPAILGWQQADVLVAALTSAASADDLTRASVGAAGVALAPNIAEAAVYEIELNADRNATLSIPGGSGLEEIFTESDIPRSVSSPCS